MFNHSADNSQMSTVKEALFSQWPLNLVYVNQYLNPSQPLQLTDVCVQLKNTA